jgi:hypothetical protein
VLPYHARLIKDIKKKHYGVASDHCALLLKLDINKEKKTNKMMNEKIYPKNLRIDNEKLRDTRNSYPNSVKIFINNLE